MKKNNAKNYAQEKEKMTKTKQKEKKSTHKTRLAEINQKNSLAVDSRRCHSTLLTKINISWRDPFVRSFGQSVWYIFWVPFMPFNSINWVGGTGFAFYFCHFEFVQCISTLVKWKWDRCCCCYCCSIIQLNRSIQMRKTRKWNKKTAKNHYIK